MDQNITTRALAWLQEHRQEMLALLAELIGIESFYQKSDDPEAPFGQGPRQALDYMLEVGERFGFIPTKYAGGVASLALREGEVDTAFWGHLDVVPPGDGWEYPPFTATLAGDYMIGRGVADNKGSVVAILYILRCLMELGIPMNKNYALFLGTDEERGMADIEAFLQQHRAPLYSVIPDCSFPVCYAEKGIITATLSSIAAVSPSLKGLYGGTASNVIPDAAWMLLQNTPDLLDKLEDLPSNVTYDILEEGVRLTATGVSGHTAFPDNSVNAIGELTHTVMELELLPPSDLDALYFVDKVNEDVCGSALRIVSEDDISGPLTCVGSTIRLENGRIKLGVNIRYPVKSDGAKLISSMQTSAAQYGYTVETVTDSRPNYFPQNHELVQVLMQACEPYLPEGIAPYAMAGGTYARKLPNAVGYGPGMPCAYPPELFKPGHGGAHCPDEAVYLPNLFKAMEIYLSAILTMDEVDFSSLPR